MKEVLSSCSLLNHVSFTRRRSDVCQDGRGVKLGNDDGDRTPIGCFLIEGISGLLGRCQPMRNLVTY
jgi:hypothetical protein